MPRYILYGVRSELVSRGIGEGYDEVEERQPVATFDTPKQAQAYIEASKKRGYKDFRNSWRHEEIAKQFKAKSLLRYYSYAEIEEEIEIPHNPDLP